MSKYSVELKHEVVLYYLSGKVSYMDTVKKFSIAKSHIIKWVAAYREHGLEGLITKNGTYTGDFKISVIEYMHNTGSSASRTAAHFNIPSFTTVCTWERIYLEQGKEALFEEHRGRAKDMNKRNNSNQSKLEKEVQEDLITEVQRLRMEVDYLKKLNALIQDKEKSATKRKQ